MCTYLSVYIYLHMYIRMYICAGANCKTNTRFHEKTCHQQRELTLGKARYIDPDRLAVIAHMNLIRHGQEHIANFHSENTCRPALFHGDHDDVWTVGANAHSHPPGTCAGALGAAFDPQCQRGALPLSLGKLKRREKERSHFASPLTQSKATPRGSGELSTCGGLSRSSLHHRVEFVQDNTACIFWKQKMPIF